MKELNSGTAKFDKKKLPSKLTPAKKPIGINTTAVIRAKITVTVIVKASDHQNIRHQRPLVSRELVLRAATPRTPSIATAGVTKL